MRTETVVPFLRKRARAFFGATIVVVALWLLAVLSVDVFASPPPLGERGHRLITGAESLPPGTLLHTSTPPGTVLHTTGGNPFDAAAWKTVVQILILIILATLFVAGLDRLRRKIRMSRRPRTV